MNMAQHELHFGEHFGETNLYTGLDRDKDFTYVEDGEVEYHFKSNVQDPRRAIVIDPGPGVQHEVTVASDGGYVVKSTLGPTSSRETYVHEHIFRQQAPLMVAILDHLQNHAVAPLEDQLRELLEHADFRSAEFQASKDRLLAALREDRVKFS